MSKLAIGLFMLVAIAAIIGFIFFKARKIRPRAGGNGIGDGVGDGGSNADHGGHGGHDGGGGDGGD